MSKPYWCTIDPMTKLTDPVIARIGLQPKPAWLIKHDLEVAKEQRRLKRNAILVPLSLGALAPFIIYLGYIYVTIAIEYFKGVT